MYCKNLTARTFYFLFPLIMGFASIASARGLYANRHFEDSAIVVNGQGISSPSFWDGVSGANPAGLIFNESLKIQGSLATFDDSTRNARGAAGLFLGTGTIAAGLEYSTYNQGPYAKGDGQWNGGVALHLETLSTTVGVSGHFLPDHDSSQYDLGVLINLSSSLRLGALVPDATHQFHRFAGGLTLQADPAVDLVVDMGYDTDHATGVVKPGLSLHTEIFEVTGAYGFRTSGMADDVIVRTKFTGAIGLKLGQRIFAEYEYRGVPEHRLGLTIRFN